MRRRHMVDGFVKMIDSIQLLSQQVHRQYGYQYIPNKRRKLISSHFEFLKQEESFSNSVALNSMIVREKELGEEIEEILGFKDDEWDVEKELQDDENENSELNE